MQCPPSSARAPSQSLFRCRLVCIINLVPNRHPPAVSAIICTRTESEVEEVFDSLSDIGGIEFYSFNTVGQLLRHMLLKARSC